MDFPSTFLPQLLLILTALVIFLRTTRPKNPNSSRLPPGPTGWPIFGNMFDLGSMPHRTMAALRDRYGPVVWLRFGAVNSMVILSAKASAEFFKTHDLSFADRTVTETMQAHNYHQGSVALAPYGPYWRVLRRLLTVDMVVMKKINETAGVRRKCVDDMVSWLAAEAEEPGRGVQVAKFVFLATFNLLGNLMLSRDLVDPLSERGSAFFESMMGLMEWSGHANLADFFPWLKRVDPQRLRRRMERDLGNALEIASAFVKERVEQVKMEKNDDGNRKKDFLDVLLEFQGTGKDDEPSRIADHDINIFILEIFLAGSETTSSTIEWALTELLLNPTAMAETKEELTRVIGPDRKVEEADIENLTYLQAVIKETMRLHPPIPLLVPRKAIECTTFMGYEIPQNTQVFVNCWSIGRDPDVWEEEPLVFKPERFLGSKVDYKGQNFELIPFGAGRRMCAGVPLAHRMLHLILGSLIHQFDWELEPGVTKETMDMRDRLGVTMRKYEPLIAIPKVSAKSK